MKKEYIVFFSFILSAALITGITLGMVGNVKLILSSPAINSSIILSEQKTDPENSTENPDQTPSDEVQTEYQSNPTESMSATDKTVVESMLDKVDANKGQDYDQRIIEFQKTHSLEETGYIDSLTLGVLIQQAKLQTTYHRLTN
ncbi:MAG: hypothetical protein U9N81_05920 [Bacillota bacterium]|nr:hypothetical protein [Bacillota bacterium]